MKYRFNPSDKVKIIIVAAVVVLLTLMVTARTQNKLGHSDRIETVEAHEMVDTSSKEKEAVKTAEKTPEEKPVDKPKEKPEPKVDPNGCEVKGMWWRADNFECIPKTGIKESAPGQQTAATSVTTQSGAPAARGSGDCSLVNNYNWPIATAYRVCIQESSNNPNNANWNDYHAWANCRGSFGLMQINCSHGQVYDGAKNMAIAYQMWSAAGGSFWQDWPNTCKKVGC